MTGKNHSENWNLKASKGTKSKGGGSVNVPKAMRDADKWNLSSRRGGKGKSKNPAKGIRKGASSTESYNNSASEGHGANRQRSFRRG